MTNETQKIDVKFPRNDQNSTLLNKKRAENRGELAESTGAPSGFFFNLEKSAQRKELHLAM